MKLTDQIFKLTAPYNNPYQGTEKKLLFVCSVGMLRSPTAADIATKLGYNARSCGSSSVALIPLSVNLIAWADTVIFMNKENYDESVRLFEYHEDTEVSSWLDTLKYKSKVMHIRDMYVRNDPGLIGMIEEQLDKLLKD